LSVFSVSGRLVARVLENVPCRGLQTVSWDGTGLSGDRVASGVYLVRLEAGSEILTQKVLLLR
jgi:hypothetical protein